MLVILVDNKRNGERPRRQSCFVSRPGSLAICMAVVVLVAFAFSY